MRRRQQHNMTLGNISHAKFRRSKLLQELAKPWRSRGKYRPQRAAFFLDNFQPISAFQTNETNRLSIY